MVDYELHCSSPEPQGQAAKIISKLNKTVYLGVRNNQPVLVPADSNDPTQLWWKDTSFGERTRDHTGSPAFALVNQATRKVLKHGKEQGHPVLVADWRGGMLDEDILWTEGNDEGEGFKPVRMASDILLNMTVLEKSSFFRHEGSPLVLDTWRKEDRQMWKIFCL